MISRDLQKIVKILLKMSVISILFNFHASGSLESVSKQPTQLIVELISSLRHIIVTHTYFVMDYPLSLILIIFFFLDKKQEFELRLVALLSPKQT
jgi:hypothetical protein